jgi:hypothetical protein
VNGSVTTITNKHVPETTEITVQKVWDDAKNAAGIRPEKILVQLFADGDAVGEPAELNAGNGWRMTWEGLTRYTNPNGMTGNQKEIVYTVQEINVPEGYEVEISYGTKVIRITNKLVPGKIVIEKEFDFEPVEPDEPDDSPMDIPVIKNWDDNGNKDGNRPAAVTVRLLADGAEVASAQLTEATGWKHTFTGLPRRNGEEKITYTITEDPVEWYRAEIKGFNIRNIYEPELTSVTVKKDWKDDENAGKVRPTSIYMTLSNGTTVLLSAANNWTATVDNLPTKLNGAPVTYTWKEQEVVGYKNTAVTADGSTTVFENTLVKVPEVPKNQVPPKTPGTPVEVFEEYETALGIPVLINHVGDCFD